MNREVVDALLRRLDERVAVEFPGEVFRFSVHLFERLINRHGADRHRRVTHDPLARLVDVFPGREIHDRIRSPARCPRHLLNFFFDG